MCMEDIRIGRKTKMRSISIAVAATNVNVLPLNPRRIAIVFWACPAATYSVNTKKMTSVFTGGGINSNSPPVTLDIQRHGTLVTDEWYAISVGGGGTIQIHEVVLDDE